MTYNRATVDVYCLAAGAANAANEVSLTETIRFRNINGKLEALNGRELERAQQIRSDIRWRFTCRQPGIAQDDFLCVQGRDRKLNVAAVLPDERFIDYEILCAERV